MSFLKKNSKSEPLKRGDFEEYSVAVKPEDAYKYKDNKEVGVLVYSTKAKYYDPLKRNRAQLN